MTFELVGTNQSQNLYVHAYASAWSNRTQLWDPAVWLRRDPEAEEKMLRDADIAHALNYRQALVAGNTWAVEPKRKNSPRAPMAVMVAEELLDHIGHFTKARNLLSRAFFSGARFARIHGRAQKMRLGDGVLRTWWVPTRLEDIDKRMYRIVPDADTQSAHWERFDVWQKRWEPESRADAIATIRHVYQDDQATLGYGRALREALGWWWYAKTHVFQESLQAVERFAQGVLRAKIGGLRDANTNLPNTELIRQWTNVLEDLRSRHVLVHDDQDEVEHITMNSDGWQLLTDVRKELRSTIFTLVMGANLTTAADEGGSYALAEVQENSTALLVRYDREALEETLSKRLLGCVWFKNHANLVELGIADEKPTFSIPPDTRQDPQERATVASTLNGMGVPLRKAELYEQTGFTEPEPGEDVIEGRTEPVLPAGGGFFPQ